MLQYLEHLFWKSHLSLDKFGFLIPDRVPTKLEEAVSLWMSLHVKTRQGQLLDSLNMTHPKNDKQKMAFDLIMDSILHFKDANRDEIVEHIYHFIGGLDGDGESSLFKNFTLHAK